MRCKSCGRRSSSNPCSQCKISSMEYEAQEYDYEEWGREAKPIEDGRKKALKGAEKMKKKWRKKKL